MRAAAKRLPTVKIEADSERGFLVINEADFDPDRHTRYAPDKPVPDKAAGSEDGSKDDSSSEPADAPGPAGRALTYVYAANGRWTVYVDGEAAEKGRGKEDLKAALAARGTSMDEADEVDG